MLISSCHPWDSHSASLPPASEKAFASFFLRHHSLDLTTLLEAASGFVLEGEKEVLTLFATALSANSIHPSENILPLLPCSFFRRFLRLGSADQSIQHETTKTSLNWKYKSSTETWMPLSAHRDIIASGINAHVVSNINIFFWEICSLLENVIVNLLLKANLLEKHLNKLVYVQVTFPLSWMLTFWCKI